MTGKPLAWLTGVGAVIKSYATGPDGVSYAPGRLMAAVLFVVAQALLVVIAERLLRATPALKVADWYAYLTAFAQTEGAVCTICVGLILGIAPSDPGGKWWDKNASPPPDPGIAINRNSEHVG